MNPNRLHSTRKTQYFQHPHYTIRPQNILETPHTETSQKSISMIGSAPLWKAAEVVWTPRKSGFGYLEVNVAIMTCSSSVPHWGHQIATHPRGWWVRRWFDGRHSFRETSAISPWDLSLDRSPRKQRAD